MNKPAGKIFKKAEDLLQLLNPLHGKGRSDETVEEKMDFETLEHNKVTWIDIENPKKKELGELLEKYDFHPLHLESCVSVGELDRVEFEKDYVFILLHNPSYDHIQKKIISTKVCIFIGENYVITVHKHHRRTLHEAFISCKENVEFRDMFFRKSSARLLHSIINVFEKDISNHLHEALQELDDIEDVVFDTSKSGVFEISQMRQKIVRLRRVTLSFKEITQSLVTSQHLFVTKSSRYFRNLSNSFNKLLEILDETRETVEIYKDADFTVSTEKTNKILTVLTIVFTFSIPATVLGAIYGMNVILPGGVDSKPWDFFGEFTTFYILIGTSIVSVVFMLLYFKYKEWF